MDKGLRVVGFTFSNSESTTLSAEVSSEVSNAKLQTQRSLLSELLAIHAVGDDGLSNSESDDSAEDDDDDYDATEEAAPVVRAETLGQTPSCPITIPCPEALANQRAKDAYRRLLHQRQAEHLYYQQQQQLQYQQYQAQQQLWIQQQRRMQLLQQQHQAALSNHATRQEHDVDVQSRGQTATVPVY